MNAGLGEYESLVIVVSPSNAERLLVPRIEDGGWIRETLLLSYAQFATEHGVRIRMQPARGCVGGMNTVFEKWQTDGHELRGVTDNWGPWTIASIIAARFNFSSAEDFFLLAQVVVQDEVVPGL
jgi:hypothetical protein